ncbi:heavy-metal-associated domain-containing protein [Pseudomonas oligotrophica]|uniref:heavy-metal-associated domain-containing protein n=1 Tax=Pseudomonas oligotrophica TaxID=2912055 RepID=UPI001F3D0341|nr:heavy metal-associated domain-containing protein [Pseudomonas oligotrophica]MCF7202108.1 heavy-metal-associated domain-containing protein [Pseudomonas oligotrophica]
MNTTTLKVTGMSCGSCVRHVTAALEGLDGVGRIDVELAGGIIRVEGSAQPETLIAALDEAGYPAEATATAPAAPAKKTGCGGSSGCCCR